MFFSVLLILATIWTSSDGALSCKTDKGLECVFPFKSSAGGSENNKCKAASKGRTWCATAVKKDLVYSAWGYCDLDTCKEVDIVAEASKQIQLYGSCYACIEHAPQGPPTHWKCLEPCVFHRDKSACFQCLVETATRQCLVPCGLFRVLKSHAFLTHSQASITTTTEKCTRVVPVGKKAIQTKDTSTSTEPAMKVIDGNAMSATTVGTVTTNTNQLHPWIAVQISAPETSTINVKKVIIINGDYPTGQALKNMTVFVADHHPTHSDSPFMPGTAGTQIGHLFFDEPAANGQIIEVTSNTAMGSWVVIQMNTNASAKRDILTLSEIIIFN